MVTTSTMVCANSSCMMPTTLMGKSLGYSIRLSWDSVMVCTLYIGPVQSAQARNRHDSGIAHLLRATGCLDDCCMKKRQVACASPAVCVRSIESVEEQTDRV